MDLLFGIVILIIHIIVFIHTIGLFCLLLIIVSVAPIFLYIPRILIVISLHMSSILTIIVVIKAVGEYRLQRWNKKG
ncbi:MAG: hypothetical protein ACE5KH_00600 [Candidatus Geothermarchaeales archaeon]